MANLPKKQNAQNIDLGSLCQELEASRNLKKQLIEEVKHRFPFNDEYVSKEKLVEYIALLQQLSGLYKKEDDLLETLPKS